MPLVVIEAGLTPKIVPGTVMPMLETPPVAASSTEPAKLKSSAEADLCGCRETAGRVAEQPGRRDGLDLGVGDGAVEELRSRHGIRLDRRRKRGVADHITRRGWPRK